MTSFDWPGLLKAGGRGAGVKPEEVWRLTPAELALILGQDAAARPLTRGRLAELEAAYPDRTMGEFQ